MNHIIVKIEERIVKLDNSLPDLLNGVVKEASHMKMEIKRYKRQNLLARTRNFFLVMFVLAVLVLVLGEKSYYYVGGGAFLLALFLLSPTARYARNLANAQQKLFLMYLLEELRDKVSNNQSSESPASLPPLDDFEIG